MPQSNNYINNLINIVLYGGKVVTSSRHKGVYTWLQDESVIIWITIWRKTSPDSGSGPLLVSIVMANPSYVWKHGRVCPEPLTNLLPVTASLTISSTGSSSSSTIPPSPAGSAVVVSSVISDAVAAGGGGSMCGGDDKTLESDPADGVRCSSSSLKVIRFAMNRSSCSWTRAASLSSLSPHPKVCRAVLKYASRRVYLNFQTDFQALGYFGK